MDGCDEHRTSQGQINLHLQKDHKASFTCSKCPKFFATANGRDKHFKKHFKYTNICSVCKKGFQFPGQLTVHERSHSESTQGKFICLTRDCNAVLLSKQNLTAHQKIHDEGEFPCDKCDKIYTTDLRLKQHLQGKHGNGTLMLCGKSYQRADTKYRHQKECDKCLKIKGEQEEKPDFPNPIFRPRKQKKTVLQFLDKEPRSFCKYRHFYKFLLLQLLLLCTALVRNDVSTVITVPVQTFKLGLSFYLK